MRTRPISSAAGGWRRRRRRRRRRQEVRRADDARRPVAPASPGGSGWRDVGAVMLGGGLRNPRVSLTRRGAVNDRGGGFGRAARARTKGRPPKGSRESESEGRRSSSRRARRARRNPSRTRRSRRGWASGRGASPTPGYQGGAKKKRRRDEEGEGRRGGKGGEEGGGQGGRRRRRGPRQPRARRPGRRQRLPGRPRPAEAPRCPRAAEEGRTVLERRPARFTRRGSTEHDHARVTEHRDRLGTRCSSGGGRS